MDLDLTLTAYEQHKYIVYLTCFQSFLELPIEVKYGCIGKLSLKIPWTNLSNSPVVVTVQVNFSSHSKETFNIHKYQDILVVAAPLNHRPYNAEKDEKLEKTRKRRFLQKLEGISVLKKAAKSQNSKVISITIKSLNISFSLLLHHL